MTYRYTHKTIHPVLGDIARLKNNNNNNNNKRIALVKGCSKSVQQIVLAPVLAKNCATIDLQS